MSFLYTALRATRHSTHPKYQMAALIASGGRVIALAANSGRWGHHAETRALKLASSVGGCTIYVARENGRLSRPCADCIDALRHNGIVAAVYFDCLGIPTKEYL